MDPKKVATIENWPLPKNVHDVQSFLGLGNYFKHYIQGYTKLVLPLRELTRKRVPFKFGESAVQAFNGLKYCLSHAPVLVLPDPDLPFEVVVDACDYGCGAVLLQDQRPVAFHSYKLSSAERNYPIGEQELLAVITALRQWRCHLEGAKEVVVVTDHKPNTFLDSKPSVQLSRRQARWQEFLSRFDFKWEYRKGCASVADPISRCPALLNDLMSWAPDGCETDAGSVLRRVRDGYACDKWFEDEKNTAHLSFREGMWKKNGLIVVPDVADLRERCQYLHMIPPLLVTWGMIVQCIWCSRLTGGLALRSM